QRVTKWNSNKSRQLPPLESNILENLKLMSQQWNPLQDLVHLQDRMNRLFEDATQRRTTSQDTFEHADWTPPADIYETATGYIIAIDLPGIEREGVEIDLDENRL